MTPPRPLLVLAAALALAGCGGAEFPADAFVAAVPGQAPEALAALRVPDDGPGGQFEVFVDLSLTMRPFLEAPGATQAPYYRLLERLSNDLGGDVTFFGFGLRPGAAAQSVDRLGGVSPLLAAAAYDRLNNDYADLFARFVPDSGAVAEDAPTRVVLTDGVESDAESGRRYGGVVAAVDGWVRAGGAFAALVFRTPYVGTYYPEAAACVGTSLRLTCDDRPAVAFVFAPDVGRIAKLRAALRTGGQAPDYALVVGGPSEYALGPVEEVAVAGQRRPDELLRDVRTLFVDDTQPFTAARVSQQAVDADGFFPLTVAAAAPASPTWDRLGPAQRAAFLGSLRPEVRAWAVEEAGRDAAGRDSVVLHPVEVVEQTGAEAVAVDSAGTLRVTVPVRRPAVPEGLRRVRWFAWLVTVTPYETAPLLVPDALSTTVDCAAGRCSQILNLGPLLGAVLRDDYVPGRALFVTHWPG